MDKINDIHVLIYIHDTCLERGKEIVMIYFFKIHTSRCQFAVPSFEQNRFTGLRYYCFSSIKREEQIIVVGGVFPI